MKKHDFSLDPTDFDEVSGSHQAAAYAYRAFLTLYGAESPNNVYGGTDKLAQPNNMGRTTFLADIYDAYQLQEAFAEYAYQVILKHGTPEQIAIMQADRDEYTRQFMWLSAECDDDNYHRIYADYHNYIGRYQPDSEEGRNYLPVIGFGWVFRPDYEAQERKGLIATNLDGFAEFCP